MHSGGTRWLAPVFVVAIAYPAPRVLTQPYVSNQSFASRGVDITVWIDDLRVIDQEFRVKDQHNWILFNVPLAEGSHALCAEVSAESAQLEMRFEFEAEMWAVLEFWKDEGTGFFTWKDADRPVGFD